MGLLAVLGCGGGGDESVPLADLQAKFTAAFCGNQVACGYLPDEATCAQVASRDLQIYADVSSGKAVYDGQAAARCVDGYATFGCNVSDQIKIPALTQTCDAIVAGAVPNGGACLIGGECVSQSCNTGTCNRAACCAGTCQAKVAAGGDCLSNGSICITGTYCRYDGSTSSATCAPLLASGQPCNVGDQCAPGSLCLADQVTGTPGTCGKPPGEGSACPVGLCDSALDVCDATTKTCLRRVAVGGACASIDACVPYAHCDTTAGVCVARGGAGAACTTDGDCVLGLSCTNGACAGPADIPACPA
jgi:hypothetical protein